MDSSELNTTSTVWNECITGSHLFRIHRFSLLRGIGIGNGVKSDAFTIGKHKWTLDVYPDGHTTHDGGFVSMYLRLNSSGDEDINSSGDEDTKVRAQWTFSVLQYDGSPSPNNTRSTQLCYFKKGSALESHGFGTFARLTDLEKSKLIQDDTLSIKCTVMVVKGPKLEETIPLGVFPIPSPKLSLEVYSLLQTEVGSDINFVVGGETFKAHRCIVAARSPVFKAELYGPMKENKSDTITINDVEPEIFKSLLHFIYSDTLSHGDVNRAKKLLAVADRYEIGRLTVICEDFLCYSLNVKNVAEILILAERHSRVHLKEACVRCLSCPENFKAVALSEEFSTLMDLCPFLKTSQLKTDPVGAAGAGQIA